ncbi:MAG: cold-shock protein [Bacteroidales bacterium]
MAKGKVKWYDEIKGYGFIESETGGDIFVHRTGLDDSFNGLETDQTVEFETKTGDKGLVAINVKVVDQD